MRCEYWIVTSYLNIELILNRMNEIKKLICLIAEIRIIYKYLRMSEPNNSNDE
jgi:hypothetical protein